MREIKVLLQFPWKFSDTPYYRDLLGYPPKGINYINPLTRQGIITSKKKFMFLNKLKGIVRDSFDKIGVPIANAHHANYEGKYDLLHCAHCLSLENRPWVADFESYWQMWISGRRTKEGRKKVYDIIKRENCKKIMCWSEKTKENILRFFPDMKEKLEVVYPGIPLHVKRKKISRDKIRILYSARYFWIKGGLISLEVFKRIKKNHPEVEIIFISDTPEKIKKRYKEIKFCNLMPQEKLFDLLKETDIFFYPSFIDTFGFMVLESMSFGVPVITLNTHETEARKEMIIDGKEGFLLDIGKVPRFKKIGEREKKIIEELTKKTERLILDKKLRETMSKECIKTIEKGRFSIYQRNIKIKKIYEEALK